MGLINSVVNFFKNKKQYNGRAYDYILDSHYMIMTELEKDNLTKIDKEMLQKEFIKIGRIINYLVLKSKINKKLKEKLKYDANFLKSSADIQIKINLLNIIIPKLKENSIYFKDIYLNIADKLF